MHPQEVIEKYHNVKVTTASPLKLVVLLYDGLIRFLKEAKNNIKDNNIEYANTNLKKSQKIIFELMKALNLKEGREIAHNLHSIYFFITERLIECVVKKDTKIIDEILNLIIPLRDAFEASEKDYLKKNNNKGFKDIIG